jgi:DNA-binding NarL/FixJ family response regulator
LLDRLRELVDCDLVGYEEIDQAHDRTIAYEACARGREADASQPLGINENFWRLRDQFPLCAYEADRTDLGARKVSDFVTRRQWHRLEVYVEYFRFYSTEDKMLVWLPAPPSYKKILGFDRCGERDFGERERFLLNLLQPHLSALDTAARERRLAAALQIEQDGARLVVLKSSEQLDFATPAAERLLADYFPGHNCQLPEAIRAWLHSDATRLNGDALPHPAIPPLKVECGDRRLTIRKAGSTLLLDEEITTLTNRERELVDALAEGCSNTEIAERLMIAPTTVRKHLENIYAKLGVNNRTAAVAATAAHSRSARPRIPTH